MFKKAPEKFFRSIAWDFTFIICGFLFYWLFPIDNETYKFLLLYVFLLRGIGGINKNVRMFIGAVKIIDGFIIGILSLLVAAFFYKTSFFIFGQVWGIFIQSSALVIIFAAIYFIVLSLFELLYPLYSNQNQASLKQEKILLFIFQFLGTIISLISLFVK